MAVYMGFEEIYLLGMDQNFSIDIDENGNVVEKKEIICMLFKPSCQITSQSSHFQIFISFSVYLPSPPSRILKSLVIIRCGELQIQR